MLPTFLRTGASTSKCYQRFFIMAHRLVNAINVWRID